MLVRILKTFDVGGQTLNAGLLCSPDDALARDWIAQGLVEAVEPAAAPAGAADSQAESVKSRRKG